MLCPTEVQQSVVPSRRECLAAPAVTRSSQKHARGWKRIGITEHPARRQTKQSSTSMGGRSSCIHPLVDPQKGQDTKSPSLISRIVVKSAPTRTKTLSRLQTTETETRPRLYLSKKNYNKTEQISFLLVSFFFFFISHASQNRNDSLASTNKIVCSNP